MVASASKSISFCSGSTLLFGGGLFIIYLYLLPYLQAIVIAATKQIILKTMQKTV